MNLDLPSGFVTFLFTDLEDSTRLWESYPNAMLNAMARHDPLLREAVKASGGIVVKTTGDGLHAVFKSAANGVEAAYAIQTTMAEENWGEVGKLRVRMSVYTGEAHLREGDYE